MNFILSQEERGRRGRMGVSDHSPFTHWTLETLAFPLLLHWVGLSLDALLPALCSTIPSSERLPHCWLLRSPALVTAGVPATRTGSDTNELLSPHTI